MYLCCCSGTVTCLAEDLLLEFTSDIQMLERGNNEIKLFLARMRIWRGTLAFMKGSALYKAL